MKLLKLCLIGLIITFPALPVDGHATTCGGTAIAAPAFDEDGTLPAAAIAHYSITHATASAGVASLVMEGSGELSVREFDHTTCTFGEIKCSMQAPVATCPIIPTTLVDHQVTINCNQPSTPCPYKFAVVFG